MTPATVRPLRGLPLPFVIAGAELRRILRDRTGMFFLLLLPFLVIFIVGASVGGYSTFRVGVVASDHGVLASDLVRALRASDVVQVTVYDDAASAGTAVRRGERDAAVVVPAGFTDRLLVGRRADVGLVVGSDPSMQQSTTAAVSAIVARQGARLQAASFAAKHDGGTLVDHLPMATRLQQSTPTVSVRTQVVDSASDVLPMGFGYSAPTMLVLFVFVNALAGGAAMISTRELGIHARALASPARPSSIVMGEALCYLTMALLQSLLIVGVGSLLFGVSWGDPLAACALVLTWALVGAGAGMLSGTLFRTSEQASAIGPATGIALGMLGGCMWPLAIVSPIMRTIGHIAPQAWAVDAWTVVLSHGGGIVDIARQLTVLLAVAVGLLVLASLRLRRRLVG